jgi:Methyltransferase domain
MDTPEQVQAKISELSRNVWLAGAVELAFASGLLARLSSAESADALAAQLAMPPLIVRTLLDVLAASGFVAREGDQFVSTPAVTALTARGSSRLAGAMLHSSLGQMHALARAVEAAQLAEGWTQDADVIRAQGIVSEVATAGFMAQLARQLPEAQAQLSAPGASFLDVGAGAAGVCVAMCRLYPELRVVGLEPFAGPLAEARTVVAASPFAARITLRAHGLERLDDADAYDAAYVAQMFFPDAVVADGMARVLRSLKPGGWVFTGSVYDPGEGLAAAMGRFTSAVWGGGARTAAHVAALLRESGFVDVATPPAPGNVSPVLGRKPR